MYTELYSNKLQFTFAKQKKGSFTLTKNNKTVQIIKKVQILPHLHSMWFARLGYRGYSKHYFQE